VRLTDGRVLLVGLALGDLFDPDSDTITATGAPFGTPVGQPVLLRDGRALVISPKSPTLPGAAAASLYDPSLGTFTSVPGVTSSGAYDNRAPFSAVMARSDGGALAADGRSAWVFDVTTLTLRRSNGLDRVEPLGEFYSLQYSGAVPLSGDRYALAARKQSGGPIMTFASLDPAQTPDLSYQTISNVFTFGDLSWNWSVPATDATGTMLYVFGNHMSGGLFHLKLFAIDTRAASLDPPEGEFSQYRAIPTYVLRLADGTIAGIWSDRTFATFTPDVTPVTSPPAAPESLRAAPAAAETAADLNWVDPAEDESGFRVEARHADGSLTTQSLPANTTTHRLPLPEAWNGTVRVGTFNAAGTSWTDSVPLAVSSGRLAAPARVNFGRLKVGRSKSLKMKLRNTSRTEPLFLTGSVSVPAFAGDITPALIAPRGKVVLTVTFTPTVGGLATGEFRCASSGIGQATVAIALKGAGK
jgi:hypothetical protein